jgi:hypothetical protein
VNVRSGLLHGGCLAALALVVATTSPPSLLTTIPIVYHDEYALMSPAVAALDGNGLSLAPFGSTPALTKAFGGEGSFTPALDSGFYVAEALWFRIVGIGIRQGRMFSFVLGMGVVVAVYILGTQWVNAWVGLTAALLLALDSTFWYAARQVRPETFTAGAYLCGASLLSIRSDRARNWRMALAGAAIGAGLCGHPCGAVMAPVVLSLPFISPRGWRRPRDLAGLAAPIALLLLAYGVFLAWHWDGVREAMRLHDVHRGIHPLALGERWRHEWDRYGGGYANVYSQVLGVRLRAAAFGGWLLLLGSLLVRGLGRQPSRPGERILAVAPAVIMLGLAILGEDNNFLYLVHLYPWLYLAAAAGLAAAARLALPWPQAMKWVALAGCGLTGALAVAGVLSYRRELIPFDVRPAIPYEEIERLLASQIAPGAFVIGTENVWLAARSARAEFVFDQQYPARLPAYSRYPVHARFDGSHLLDYSLDVALLRTLSEAGTPVYYVSDAWDWRWNAYAPYGRYAASFRQLTDQLKVSFAPVMRIHTRTRGLVSLYRLRPWGVGEEPDAPIIYVESERYREGPVVEGRSGISLPAKVSLPNVGRAEPVLEWAVTPGQPYWLHLELHLLRGEMVVPVWSGTGVSTYLDARVTVPFDTVVYSATGIATLELMSYPAPARVLVEHVSLTQLLPAR